jgi:hypothetical protein
MLHTQTSTGAPEAKEAHFPQRLRVGEIQGTLVQEAGPPC